MERWQLKIAVFIFLVCSVLDWLKQWWLCTALFLAISCLVSAAYMLFREETK